MFDILGKLNEAKQKAEEVKARLDKNEFTSDYGGVTVRVTGNKKIVSILISEEVISSENKSVIESNITKAVNDALESAGRSAEAEMAAITKGILPGM